MVVALDRGKLGGGGGGLVRITVREVTEDLRRVEAHEKGCMGGRREGRKKDGIVLGKTPVYDVRLL